ncbi:MAG: hypothetical protein ABJC04_05055, partial [Verrucomicrobiota bacterium]
RHQFQMSDTKIGKVIQVRNSPVVTQNVVTYDTVIEVNNRDLKLKPGMTANVSVVVAQKNDVLKIPNAALRFRPPEIANTKTNASPTAPGATPATNGASASRGGDGRGGRGGGQGGPRSGGAARAERSGPKTVYLAEKKMVDGKTIIEPKAVQIKTGITDSLMTEVTEGLQEGDEVISGIALSDAESAKPAANPFGGGMRRF